MGKAIANYKLDGWMTVVNDDEIVKYCKGKIGELSQFGSLADYETILNLLEETSNNVDREMSQAQMDFSFLEDLIGFNSKNYRKQMVLTHNYIDVLGGIIYSIFNEEGNRIVSLEDGVTDPFDTKMMILEALCQLNVAKGNNSEYVFGGTLIFMTLLEEGLKSRTKEYYNLKFIKELEVLQERMNEEEKDLYNYLRSVYEFDKEPMYSQQYIPSPSLSRDIYNLYINTLRITDNDDKKFLRRLCVEESLTLNQLINSKAFKDIFNRKYTRVLEDLFLGENLNLRNNMTHGNLSKGQNYFNPRVTALLYILYSLLSFDNLLNKK